MDINNSKDTLFGDLPDGLFCIENGDIIVACFGSGKILYVPKKDDGFGNAVEIKKGLGHATDCVIGPSSAAGTNSLFVTTKRTTIVSFEDIAQGKVIEIPDIEQIIENTSRLNK
jgi:hypothetical protein